MRIKLITKIIIFTKVPSQIRKGEKFLLKEGKFSTKSNVKKGHKMKKNVNLTSIILFRSAGIFVRFFLIFSL